MSLTLHFHPLSSFCWKALIALYENDTPFTANKVDLGNPVEREALLKLSPIGRFPVLEDTARREVVPESSIIIEYLDQNYPGRIRFIPAGPQAALETRLRDRFLDLYLHLQMQKVVGDRLRPPNGKDPQGVEQAKAQIRKSYDIFESQLTGSEWSMGDNFGLVDCAAAPPLFYCSSFEPFGERRKLTVYFERLKVRRSVARVLKEAEPYFAMFPKE
jgi:glutathione S-transferase